MCDMGKIKYTRSMVTARDVPRLPGDDCCSTVAVARKTVLRKARATRDDTQKQRIGLRDGGRA